MRGLIVPMSISIGVLGAFFVPKDWVILWVLFWAALGSWLSQNVFPKLKQSYTYRPDLHQVTIHFDCGLPVKIVSPKNKVVWATIVDGKKLWMYDEGLNPTDLLLAGNSFSKAIFRAGTLSITHQNKAGYRINWAESETWKVE